MRRLALAPLSAVGILLLAMTANAGEVVGLLASVSTDQGQIILDSGEAYMLGEGVSLEGLEPGMPVIVNVEEQDGQLVAVDVQPAE